jgi:hypothetical protein
VLAGALAGCSVEPPQPGSEGGSGEQDELEPNFPDGETAGEFFDCLIDDWTLDVEAYGSDSLRYLKDLGIPIGEFTMSGVGKLTFDGFGGVMSSVALTSKYTLIPDGVVVFDGATNSAYDGQGFWSPGQGADDTLDFDDWVSTTTTAPGPGEAGPPPLDFTGIQGLAADCEGDKLYLKGPEGQIPSFWNRA